MPKTLRTLAIGLVLALSASASSRAQAAGGVAKLERVAVVDVQRCLLETQAGRRAKKDLEGSFAKGQSRLDGKAKDLQKRLEDLRAKAAMLNPEELDRRQQELLRSQQELQDLSGKLQEEIAQKEALLTEKIYKQVSAIVRQIALEEQVQVVLVRSQMTVLYANPKLDLTNRVIVAFDKKHP